MLIGGINELEIIRIGDIAYTLSDGENEIFFHKKEALKEHSVGEKVTVFIYQDSKKRICASENKPVITVLKPEFLKIVSYKEEVGYFLYDGMPKDLLLSADDYLFEDNTKPQIGDYLFVFLKATNGTFRARLVPKQMYDQFLVPKGELVINDFYEAFVNEINLNGVNCVTRDGFHIYIPRGNDRNYHRIGEMLNVQVIKEVDESHYHGTLLKNKVAQMDEDSKKIFNYLKKIEPVLFENDEPIHIYSLFQMSKAAFKRAIGHLYKEGLVDINNSVISLRDGVK